MHDHVVRESDCSMYDYVFLMYLINNSEMFKSVNFKLILDRNKRHYTFKVCTYVQTKVKS